MLANEGNVASGTRGPPPINSKPTFSFSMWLIMFGAFLMKFPLVYAAFQMEVPKKETAEEKEERIEEYGEDSRKAYSYLVDACASSPVAMGIVLNHAATDETCWANTLLKRLTARFTLQASTRLQNLIGEFNILTVAPEETGALFMDRYNAKVAAISAIDIKQLPTKLSRLNVLKTAIKSAFPILFAVMTLKEAEANNVEALEDKFAQLITEWNQENELGKKAQQELASVAQFTQFTEAFKNKNGTLKKAFLRKQNSGRGEEFKEIRRCFTCDSKNHVKKDCPENAEGQGKRKLNREDNRNDRDDSNFEKKKKKKMEFPLKSAFKRNKDKKSDRRNNFFDAKGDGGSSDEYSSANMIYFSEAVIEDVDQEDGDDQTEETAFVIITAKMQAAFSAVFSLLMTWVCVDSACNVNLMNFLPDGHTNYQEVTFRNGISTAGKDGHLRVKGTFTWGNTDDIKYCPDARASLFSTRFFMAKRCDVLFTGRDGVDKCKILCFTGTEPEESVPRRVVHAEGHGGLFWISPGFQKDLVYRNGLDRNGRPDEYDEEDYAADVQVGAAVIDMVRETELRQEDEEYYAIPWEEHRSSKTDQEIVQRSFLLMKERFVDDEYEDIEAISRQCAEINPYAKRLMLEIERDPEYMASIEHPEYTHKEDLAFYNYSVAKNEASWRKKRRGLEDKELAVVENMFFMAWLSGHILAPSGRILYSTHTIASDALDTHLSTDHVSEITSAHVTPVAIVTPVNDNKDNIFYFKDFSSELVKASSVDGCTSYKAIPVCSLASSVSVDVLGLMHERTGHFNKRGLIECVTSKFMSGLKIEDKDIRKFIKSDKHVRHLC